jgi:hypothetical protein
MLVVVMFIILFAQLKMGINGEHNAALVNVSRF